MISYNPKIYAITVESKENQVHYETPEGKFCYRYPIKMDEPLWINLMCNEPGRLYQGWKTHVGTNTI